VSSEGIIFDSVKLASPLDLLSSLLLLQDKVEKFYVYNARCALTNAYFEACRRLALRNLSNKFLWYGSVLSPIRFMTYGAVGGNFHAHPSLLLERGMIPSLGDFAYDFQKYIIDDEAPSDEMLEERLTPGNLRASLALLNFAKQADLVECINFKYDAIAETLTSLGERKSIPIVDRLRWGHGDYRAKDAQDLVIDWFFRLGLRDQFFTAGSPDLTGFNPITNIHNELDVAFQFVLERLGLLGESLQRHLTIDTTNRFWEDNLMPGVFPAQILTPTLRTVRAMRGNPQRYTVRDATKLFDTNLEVVEKLLLGQEIVEERKNITSDVTQTAVLAVIKLTPIRILSDLIDCSRLILKIYRYNKRSKEYN
jgi:hypothetical protein